MWMPRIMWYQLWLFGYVMQRSEWYQLSVAYVVDFSSQLSILCNLNVMPLSAKTVSLMSLGIVDKMATQHMASHWVSLCCLVLVHGYTERHYTGSIYADCQSEQCPYGKCHFTYCLGITFVSENTMFYMEPPRFLGVVRVNSFPWLSSWL